MRARVESIDDSVARLSERIEDAATRAQQTRAEFETVQGRVGELDQGEVGLDEQHERTVAALRLAEARVAELQAAERGAERQVASLRARIDALSVGLSAKTAPRGFPNHSGTGLLGPIANLVKVRSGYEAALAAVLGSAADALAAEAPARRVRRSPRSRRPTEAARRSSWATGLPRRLRGRVSAARWRPVGARFVEAPRGCAARCSPCFRAWRWSMTWPRRSTWWPSRPQLRAVTLDGDVVGAGRVSGGSDRKPQHARGHLRDRQGRQRTGRRGDAGGPAERRAVRRTDRADRPPGLRRGRLGRAQ